MNSGNKDQTKNLFLIPGEDVLKKSILFNCSVALTSYRIYLICKNTKNNRTDEKYFHIGIPLNLILKIEQLEFKYIRIWTKLSFENTEICNDWLKSITESILPKKTDSVFAFKFHDAIKEIMSCREPVWSSEKDRLEKEFKRMNFNTQWKITTVNKEFKLCNSYPRYHIVPHAISNEQLNAMADFRGNKRFPSVVWRSQKNGAVIIRCAQPQVGLMWWRNTNDETFFKEVVACLTSSPNKKLVIVDARHYSTAQFNRIRGGGVEYSDYYGEAEIMFMQLENIHSVRASFDYISMFAKNSDNWLTAFENSYWLKYLSKLLKSAADVAKTVDDDGRSVIIHCSDGWDRTPQLTSLAQILLDSYYRTVEGFQTLVEKEWIQFGHKFVDRCSLGSSFDNKERSPVFVQWLDCIHQLIKQYPTHFEFNETFLIKLAIHAYSGLFGNFLYNTEEERSSHNVHKCTQSIWSFLSIHNEDVVNPLYFGGPYTSEADRDRYRCTVLHPQHHTRHLHPWSRLLFEALNSVESHRMFSLDYCASRNHSLTSFQNNSVEDFHHEEPNLQEDINPAVSSNVSAICTSGGGGGIIPDSTNLRRCKSESDMSSGRGTGILADQQLSSPTASLPGRQELPQDGDGIESGQLTIPRLSVSNKLVNGTCCELWPNKSSTITSTNGSTSRFINQSCSSGRLNDVSAFTKTPQQEDNDSGSVTQQSSLNGAMIVTEQPTNPIIIPTNEARNTYQEIELVAYSSLNGAPEKTSLASISRRSSKDVMPQENGDRNSKKYFQVCKFEDSEDTLDMKESSPCDIDGIYKYTEPVNTLYMHFMRLIEQQKSEIHSLKKKSFIEQNSSLVKMRADSGSSMERPRNEDSISSHDSFILLDQQQSPSSVNGHLNGTSNTSNGSSKTSKTMSSAGDNLYQEPQGGKNEFYYHRETSNGS